MCKRCLSLRCYKKPAESQQGMAATKTWNAKAKVWDTPGLCEVTPMPVRHGKVPRCSSSSLQAGPAPCASPALAQNKTRRSRLYKARGAGRAPQHTAAQAGFYARVFAGDGGARKWRAHVNSCCRRTLEQRAAVCRGYRKPCWAGYLHDIGAPTCTLSPGAHAVL